MTSQQKSLFNRFGFALLITGAAMGLSLWLRDPLTRRSPFIFFYAAVVVSSWHGGLGPGVLSVLIGGAAADYYLLPPSGWRADEIGVGRLIIFTLLGVLVASLNGALHKAKRRYQIEAEAARKSEARAKRLAEANLIGVFFSNRAGNVRWANRECLRLLGKAPDDLAAGTVNWREATAAEHRNRDAKAARELHESGVSAPFEREQVLADGRRVPVLVGCAAAGNDHDDVVGFVLDLTERKRAEADARRNQEHLRDVAAELMIAEERERRRIATVLHDSVVQMLALAKLKIDAARRATTGGNGAVPGNGAARGNGSSHAPTPDPRLVEAYDLIDQAISQARTLTADISPPVLYELGLGPAIQWLGDRLRNDHALAVELEWDRQPVPLTEETQIVLFQAVRELMVNVAKHARASACRVRLGSDAGAGTVVIRVADDGCGFVPPASPDYSKGGFGLFNIRQRLARLGGKMCIDARPEGGTVVTLTAPLAGAVEEGAASR